MLSALQNFASFVNPLKWTASSNREAIWKIADYESEEEFQKLRHSLLRKIEGWYLQDEQDIVINHIDHGLPAVHVRKIVELDETTETPMARWCLTAIGVSAIAWNVFTPEVIAKMTHKEVSRYLSMSGLELLRIPLFNKEELLNLNQEVADLLLQPETETLGVRLIAQNVLTKQNLIPEKIEYIKKRVIFFQDYPNALRLLKAIKIDELLQMTARVLKRLCRERTIQNIENFYSKNPEGNIIIKCSYAKIKMTYIKPSKNAVQVTATT